MRKEKKEIKYIIFFFVILYTGEKTNFKHETNKKNKKQT